jgi:hypothetical protein
MRVQPLSPFCFGEGLRVVLSPSEGLRAPAALEYNTVMRLSTPRLAISLMLGLTAATTTPLLHAQDGTRGRKYTPPPPVAHVTVTVSRGMNSKPVEGAAVIFHTLHNGKDQGNLEVKTNEEGVAAIDVIPIGDTIRLQIIKSGYQTFGQDYEVDTASKEIAVKLKPPAHQYSSYDKPLKEGAPAAGNPQTPPH